MDTEAVMQTKTETERAVPPNEKWPLKQYATICGGSNWLPSRMRGWWNNFPKNPRAAEDKSVNVNIN
jgi:hypothetical protein